MTTKLKMTSERQPLKSPLSKLVWISPLAMVAATVANLGLYAAAGRLFPEVAAWPGAGPGQIVGANIVYLLIGTAVFAVITRLSSRPVRHYLIVAVIGLLFSLGMPISAGFGYGAPGTPPADAATVITLSLMHIVSFAISAPLFIRLALD
ncbi:MAG: hypothetical protein GY803_31055 [Chloroflexi bacterium]|nr:hypothetical protein [Chloroflexota bacterium]